MTAIELINDYNSAVKKAEDLEYKLNDTMADLTMLRASLRALVKIQKSTSGYTFNYNDRVIKAKLDTRGRYKVTEGKKVLEKESMDSINQIRLNIALGRI